VTAGSSFSRGGGGASVAGELQRIRSFFDKVRANRDDEGLNPPEVSSEAPQKFSKENLEDSQAWPSGTRVLSPRFGRGMITASTGRGDGLTYTIRFAEAGEKRIVARFGMLEKE
jgi:DNA helicase II / ATP-dependent DNA helicase PcrA